MPDEPYHHPTEMQKAHQRDIDMWFKDYFDRERREVWDRRCKHTGLCSCTIWEREMRDIQTFVEGRLEVVHYGNKLNLGGCNICSAIDGRMHAFDKVTRLGDGTLIVSCDCMYRTGQPEGCTCPHQGYGSVWEEEE